MRGSTATNSSLRRLMWLIAVPGWVFEFDEIAVVVQAHRAEIPILLNATSIASKMGPIPKGPAWARRWSEIT